MQGNEFNKRWRKINDRVSKLSSRMDVTEFKKLLNKARVEDNEENMDKIFDSLEKELDRVLIKITDEELNMKVEDVAITKEENINNSIKQDPVNVEKFKVGDKEYRFNITDNIVKDLMLQMVEDGGKENLNPEELTARLSDYLGDKTSESIHFKFHKVPENDRLKYYQLLVKYANFLIYEEYKIAGKDYTDVWEKLLKPLIDNGKIFELDESIVPILYATDSVETQLPFDQVIIDCKIIIEDRIYYSMITGKYIIDGKTNNEEYARIGCFSCYSKIDKEDGERKIHLDVFDIGKNKPDDKKLNKYQRSLENFFYSFCNFINEPEVEVIETKLNPKNNKRRADRGSMPLPPNRIIRLSGNLKKYVSDYSDRTSSGLNHKFIVRGHFMHFRDEKRYNKLYGLSEKNLSGKGCQISNGLIKKWIRPYSKGDGILVDKTYRVSKGGNNNGKK